MPEERHEYTENTYEQADDLHRTDLSSVYEYQWQKTHDQEISGHFRKSLTIGKQYKIFYHFGITFCLNSVQNALSHFSHFCGYPSLNQIGNEDRPSFFEERSSKEYYVIPKQSYFEKTYHH